MIADMTRGTGHYNLALGSIGAAVGIGALFSTTLAGLATERYGFREGFFFLAAPAIAAFLHLWLAMPETGMHVVEENLQLQPERADP